MSGVFSQLAILQNVLNQAAIDKCGHPVSCPKCCKSDKGIIIKSGKMGKKQRFKCTLCKYQFVNGKLQQKPGAIKHRAIQLYLSGRSLRSVAKECGVSHQTVSNWTAEYAEQSTYHRASVEAAKHSTLFKSKTVASMWL